MTWSKNPEGKGVIVAADQQIEWLLPWWWARYSSHNNYPVCFIDLGMSCFGKSFCLKRGSLIPLETNIFSLKPLQNTEQWEKIYGRDLFEKRKNSLKKPFALMKTPYKYSLWLDLDCEVLKNLDHLFEYEHQICLAKETEAEIALEKELKMIQDDEMLYNSGVILYSHGSSIIEEWKVAITENQEAFWGDQHALAHVLYHSEHSPQILPSEYNWRMSQGLNLHAVIIHWVGNWGKDYIRRFGGLAEELAKVPPL